MFGRRLPIEVKKTYKRGLFGAIERRVAEVSLVRNGYVTYSEKEVRQYNVGKGLLLGLIFLPLALLGGARYMEVTYRLKSSL